MNEEEIERAAKDYIREYRENAERRARGNAKFLYSIGYLKGQKDWEQVAEVIRRLTE
jgi:hypothetical protein